MQRIEQQRQVQGLSFCKYPELATISPSDGPDQCLAAPYRGSSSAQEQEILMISQPAAAFEIIQLAQQKRFAQANISKRSLIANAKAIGPAHIRAALMFMTRKAS
jgi:hypothetical protein